MGNPINDEIPNSDGTMLDWFAGQAMQALLVQTRPDGSLCYDDAGLSVYGSRDVARHAYHVANAMMEVRGEWKSKQ